MSRDIWVITFKDTLRLGHYTRLHIIHSLLIYDVNVLELENSISHPILNASVCEKRSLHLLIRF
jgi:hypothetical protein